MDSSPPSNKKESSFGTDSVEDDERKADSTMAANNDAKDSSTDELIKEKIRYDSKLTDGPEIIVDDPRVMKTSAISNTKQEKFFSMSKAIATSDKNTEAANLKNDHDKINNKQGTKKAANLSGLPDGPEIVTERLFPQSITQESESKMQSYDSGENTIVQNSFGRITTSVASDDEVTPTVPEAEAVLVTNAITDSVIIGIPARDINNQAEKEHDDNKFNCNSKSGILIIILLILLVGGGSGVFAFMLLNRSDTSASSVPNSTTSPIKSNLSNNPSLSITWSPSYDPTSKPSSIPFPTPPPTPFPTSPPTPFPTPSPTLFPSSSPTSCAGKNFLLNIKTDEYGSETSWSLLNYTTGDVIYNGNGYDSNLNYTILYCLEAGNYEFIMKDNAGDGMCCGYGNGYYKLFLNEYLMKSGGEFGYQEKFSFEVLPVGITHSPTPVPTTGTPTPPPTPCMSGKMFDVAILTDRFASDTSWILMNSGNSFIILSGGTGYMNETLYNQSSCLMLGNYEFIINDSGGDGICCSNGTGYYRLSLDGDLMKSGGQFTSQEKFSFVVSSESWTQCSTGPNACSKCNGDCDNDNQCRAGLKCFQRDDNATIPGCPDSGILDMDYCYAPDPISEGEFRIIHVSNPFMCMENQGGSTASFTKLVMAPCNDSKRNQFFKLTADKRLRTVVDTNVCVEMDPNNAWGVFLHSACLDSWSWQIDNNGTYYIKNDGDNLCLGLENATSITNEDKVQRFPCDVSNALFTFLW